MKAACLTGLTVLACCLGAAAASDAGTLADPLVTLKYITETFAPELKTRAGQLADEKMAEKEKILTAKVDRARGNLTRDIRAAGVAESVGDLVIARVMAKGGIPLAAGRFSDISLYEGDEILGSIGTGFVLRQGTAKVAGPASGEIINLTAGAAVKPGSAVSANAYYLTDQNGGTGFSALADGTVVAVSGGYSVKRAYYPKYTGIAEGLKQLNLFLGTNNGFELEKKATRAEALVMLIRLLGEENAALNSTAKNPFSDVDAWADRYVAYAFERGYTNGVSATKFDSASAVTVDAYVTFVLRALGYSDKDGDFEWNSSASFSVQTGLLTAAELDRLKNEKFRRDNVVYLSRNALYTPLKGSETLLSGRLMETGVISRERFALTEPLLKP